MRTAASEWSERVRAWRESGLSAEEFAKRGGYRPKTLQWWSSELVRRSRVKSIVAPTVAMARVRVAPQRAAANESVAVIVGDARIEVRRGFDSVLLCDVVRALGAAR
jgi:transposase